MGEAVPLVVEIDVPIRAADAPYIPCNQFLQLTDVGLHGLNAHRLSESGWNDKGVVRGCSWFISLGLKRMASGAGGRRRGCTPGVPHRAARGMSALVFARLYEQVAGFVF